MQLADEEGNLIVTLSDDRTIVAGVVVGKDGKDGKNGKSAYEIYLEHYPDYEGTEEEWLDDLINGRLGTKKVTITLDVYGGELPEGVESEIQIDRFQTVSLPIPSRTGSKFGGWYVNPENEDTRFLPIIPVTHDLTLIANGFLLKIMKRLNF